jgi:hypothetical protein
MWKNIVEPERPQMTVQHTHIACWIPKATNTHSEYVILISFPLQQWLHKRPSMLRYTYIVCLMHYWHNSPIFFYSRNFRRPSHMLAVVLAEFVNWETHCDKRLFWSNTKFRSSVLTYKIRSLYNITEQLKRTRKSVIVFKEVQISFDAETNTVALK